MPTYSFTNELAPQAINVNEIHYKMDLESEFRNIYIVGAQSSGKTTLVNALESTFTSGAYSPGNKPAIIKEVARTVLKAKKFTRDDITSSPGRALELQILILEAQLDAEKAALSRASWFISDRSGLDPIVYAQFYVGEREAQQMIASDKWKALHGRMRIGFVVLCEAGAWLDDDGTRLMPKDTEDWLRVDSAFCAVLKTLGIEYFLLPNTVLDVQERVQVVLAAFHNHCASQNEG